jgi:hypothetical protein
MQRGIVGGLHQQVDVVEMHGILEIDMLVSSFVLSVPSLQVENIPDRGLSQALACEDAGSM